MDDDVHICDDWFQDGERLEWIVEHDVRFVELEDGKCLVWWDGEDYIESAQHETWRDAIDAAMATESEG
jgi:hypothetical protein